MNLIPVRTENKEPALPLGSVDEPCFEIKIGDNLLWGETDDKHGVPVVVVGGYQKYNVSGQGDRYGYVVSIPVTNAIKFATAGDLKTLRRRPVHLRLVKN